jgi:hypothetical protein
MKKITKEQFLECIKGSQGLLSKVQKKLQAATGETWSWETVRNYVDKWEEAQEAIKAEKEAMLDIAENNIFRDMVNGDVGTSKWYLRMKGKERGYEDTPVIKLDNEDPLNINLTGDMESAESLAESAMVEIGNAEEAGTD